MSVDFLFAGRTIVQILEEIMKMLAEENVRPSQHKGRIIFMSMYNDINWRQNRYEVACRQNSTGVASFAEDFEPGRWPFLGPGDEEKWYGSLVTKPGWKWNSTAGMMIQELATSAHPVYRCPTPQSKGVLKSKEGENLSVHHTKHPFCGCATDDQHRRQPAPYLQSSGNVVQKHQHGGFSRSHRECLHFTRAGNKNLANHDTPDLCDQASRKRHQTVST